MHVSMKGSAKSSAIEFGAQALLAAQLENVRSAELEKAEDALNELAPEIEQRRMEGNGVTVTVVAEVPNTFDPFAYAAGVGDAGQVVYFKRMFISSITPRHAQSVKSGNQTYRADLASGDPEQVD